MGFLVFFMVYEDGCILRTYGVLGKGVFYPWCEDGFIIMSWYTLDVHLKFFTCYSMLI